MTVRNKFWREAYEASRGLDRELTDDAFTAICEVIEAAGLLPDGADSAETLVAHLHEYIYACRQWTAKCADKARVDA